MYTKLKKEECCFYLLIISAKFFVTNIFMCILVLFRINIIKQNVHSQGHGCLLQPSLSRLSPVQSVPPTQVLNLCRMPPPQE